MSWLARLYKRLPIIAELRSLQRSLRAMRRDVASIRRDIHTVAGTETVRLMQLDLAREPRYADPKRLLAHAHQTFSQDGEDGMIAEICRRIDAPSRQFVEIGVGNGLENNTVYLLSQGWQGWWIEGDRTAISSMHSTFRRQTDSGKLVLRESIVTAENIAGLFRELNVPEEFDVLSIDIDRNTYWIWAAISNYRPRVAVIEYNASFPPGVDWKVEYDPQARWDGTSNYGASLTALELLGRKMGYTLVGCNFIGVNAFFVRQDLCADRFAEPFTAENHYEPPRYELARRIGHPPGVGDPQ